MTQRNKNIKPEVVYEKQGDDGVVPSKTFSYKRDDETGEVIPVPPKTHQFENVLKREIGNYFGSNSRFPTKKPVFVSIVHGLHSKRGFKDCDLDNRAKTILDALKGVIYDDDTQVHILWTQKLFLESEEESYYHIAVKLLDDGISHKEIMDNIQKLV